MNPKSIRSVRNAAHIRAHGNLKKLPLEVISSLVERKKSGARERRRWMREEKREGEEPEDLAIAPPVDRSQFSVTLLNACL